MTPEELNQLAPSASLTEDLLDLVERRSQRIDENMKKVYAAPIGKIIGYDLDVVLLVREVLRLREEKDELKVKLKNTEKDRDDFKSKLDAELPAAWREDIESLDFMNERLCRERDEARTDIAEFKRMAVDACEYARILDASSLPELDQGPLADAVDGVIACLRTILDGRNNPHPWAFNRVLRERDEARSEVERLRATTASEEFNCCGESDETPPEHTQDCSVHPPVCHTCKKRTSVCVAAIGDAYEAICVECLLHQRNKERDEAERWRNAHHEASIRLQAHDCGEEAAKLYERAGLAEEAVQKLGAQLDQAERELDEACERAALAEQRALDAECERDACRGMEQAAEMRAERLFRDRALVDERARKAAQLLIAEVGADWPMNVDEAAEMVVKEIHRLQREYDCIADAITEERDEAERWRNAHHEASIRLQAHDCGEEAAKLQNSIISEEYQAFLDEIQSLKSKIAKMENEIEKERSNSLNAKGELIASLAEEKAAVEAADKLTAENEELKKQIISLEGQLSCAHAFHDLAVKERDFARVQLRHAEADAEQAISVLEHERDEALRAVKNLELGIDAQDQVLTRRFNDQLAATERAERERDTLVRMLVFEFGWEDSSYLHAMMHVENAIRNLKADLSVYKQECESIK